MSLHFPGATKYVKRIQADNYTGSTKFAQIFEDILNLVELSLHVFIVSTIRCYQDIIVNPPDQYTKKVKPIKSILKDRFAAPSLGTLVETARYCYHLINNADQYTPNAIIKMKQCLSESFQIQNLAIILNDIENLISAKNKKLIKVKTIYKFINKRDLLNFILPKLVEYRNTFKHVRDISLLIDDDDKNNYDVKAWEQGLLDLIDIISPITSYCYIDNRIKNLCQCDEGFIEDGKYNLKFTVESILYNGDDKTQSEHDITFSEYESTEDYQRGNISSIMLSGFNGNLDYDLFPFAVIHDDMLYFYKRTKAKGYEFFSLSDNSVYIIPTKRKFNHSLFGIGNTGDRQALFWTEVAPTLNPDNGVKANIPLEGIDKFIGRKKQIAKVKDEIIEIPNQNGIIYGPGGVGKTALMLQLSKDLFQAKSNNDISFDNIVWISAKTNYYNPLLNVIVEKEKQADSLDNIFNVILSFFDYENVDEYDFEDKQELVMQMLEENKILLILDNFETINKRESDKIIQFLGIDVKKRLKRTPHYFKVIVTSREQIPSGFHQIKLEGLDLKESKMLMNDLLKRYDTVNAKLTEEQREKLHEVTHGIPITIKHCFGQIYEFNRPFSDVIQSLSVSRSEIIKFSFSEILKLVEKDVIQLKIIILLEIVQYPLMIRQMSDILEIEENNIMQKLPSLLNFQIIERLNQGIEEKYAINDNISLFSKNIVQENDSLGVEIRKQISQNFNLDRRMDYTTQELLVLGIFNNYITKEKYLEAEDFINKHLEQTNNSHFLRFHYAKYLKEHRGEIQKAIDVLTEISKLSNKHPNILVLLVSCFLSFEPSNYKAASIYVKELESMSHDDDDIKLERAKFYIGWSSFIKSKDKVLDRVEELKRRSHYKELANNGIKILEDIDKTHRNHTFFYLLAQGYYNIWENDKALNMINEAIRMMNNDPQYYVSYSGLRQAIQKKISYQYSLRCKK